MPVRLRLQRWGRIHRPFYHIVATDHHSPRDNKALERLGTYDPLPDRYGDKHLRIDVERVYHWIKRGAQPTETVMMLLARAKIIPPAPRRNTTSCARGPELLEDASEAGTPAREAGGSEPGAGRTPPPSR